MFLDRKDAGRRLAKLLERYRDLDPVVVALPRGGVPVAVEVARTLMAPLDVLVVRKLGFPFQPELGFGAVGEKGIRVINHRLVAEEGFSDEEIDRITDEEELEVERRVKLYRAGRHPVPLRGRNVILVDDGIATGFTVRAAIEVLRQHLVSRVILAVPVASAETVRGLRALADIIVCVDTPRYLRSIGENYRDFHQLTDDDVASLLSEFAEPLYVRADEVAIPAGGVTLIGHLAVPEDALGVVIFAHGSGSSRHSPRNTAVARGLHKNHLATLLFDLLTEDEAADRDNVFDVGLLAGRLVRVTDWVRQQPECRRLSIGYFGASTGAAAALVAAAAVPQNVACVVSRGGRPDLAGDRLPYVKTPTLLIVGGNDAGVIGLNREAMAKMRCEVELEVVPNAGHLFEEPGTLALVATLAQRWFADHLAGLPASL